MRANIYLFFCALSLCLTEKAPKYNKESSNDDDDLFVPTHEWQIIKKGQNIPKGLHVRINFETGVTEAKLLDENVNEKTNAVAQVHEVNGVGAQNIKSEGNLKFDELKQALKNLKNDDVSEQTSIKNADKFRSYEELKKDLSDLNLVPKTDAEILKELLAKHKRIVNEGTTGIPQILTVLEDLEYLVHQYDNAIEFMNLKGFEEVIFKDLNSTDAEVRREALKLLGSSLQNNAKVQIHALETGSIGILLRIVALDPDFSVRNRAVFGLGGLLRRFPLAQLQFVENAGLSVFAELLETRNLKIQLKIVTLINDLALEHKHVSADAGSANYLEKLEQYNQVNLKQKLKEHDWCKHLNSLLLNIFRADPNDNDALEKCLTAILTVLDTCNVSSCKSIKNVISKLYELYKTAVLVENNDSEDFSYYTQLLDLCRQIIAYSSPEYKSEL